MGRQGNLFPRPLSRHHSRARSSILPFGQLSLEGADLYRLSGVCQLQAPASALEVQSLEVVLRNTGNRPLVIHDITTFCGCTRVECDNRPVAVGGETSIRIIYEAEHPGHFRKTADVYCNIAASRLRITVMGVAE